VSAIDERRAQFKKYKQDVKERGKPFYPYAMFHDTVMSLVVVGVIVGLASVWFYTSGENPDTCGGKDSCLLGPRYSEPADPGTTNFVPRPDWYFYFLFYLLRIFKWPDSVILGTVGIPTILLIIAFALPFLDVRSERRLSRRPVAVVAAILVVISMGELTYKGAVAKEALASEVVAAVPQWAQREGFANDPKAVAGAKVFAEGGCTSCHTYLGTGGGNLGAPDLSAEGSKGKGVQGLESYVADPSKFGNTVMPKFGAFASIPAKDAQGKDLGISQLRALAVFLDASKGPK
jgi:menaquinol-cytochrome c reductase cytochrome b/c subunit